MTRASRYLEEGRLPRLNEIDEETAKTITRIRNRMRLQDAGAYTIGAILNVPVRLGLAIGKAEDGLLRGTQQLYCDVRDSIRSAYDSLPTRVQLRNSVAGAAVTAALMAAPIAGIKSQELTPGSAYVKHVRDQPQYEAER